MKRKFTLFGPLMGALLLAGAALPAAAQNCSDLKFRLWQEKGHAWYEYGETVEILPGEEGHLYIHAKGKGPTPYTTNADIGYPSAFGLRGDAHQIREHLRLEAQDGDDRRSGRIRFTADRPGTAYLGYNVVGVKPPGDLKDLAPPCRVGKVAIRVVGNTTADVASPSPSFTKPAPGVGPKAAAQEMTEMLYRSLLRRERHDGDPQAFVDTILDGGTQGIVQVAESMAKSTEFRRQALDRTQRNRSTRSRDLAELREWLLQDIYRDLYGLLEPTPREIDDHLRTLDVCLSADRNSERACGDLARALVTHRLFAEQNHETLRNLGRGLRNPRERFRRP